MVIIQPFLMEWLPVNGYVISFVLFFTMMTSFGVKKPDIFIVPVIIGFAYDMLYSPWLGRMAVLLLLSSLLVLAVSRVVYKDNVPVLTIFFFLSTYILENIRAVLEVGFFVYRSNFMLIQEAVLWMSVYAAALAAVFGIIFFLRALIGDRKLGARKSGIT